MFDQFRDFFQTCKQFLNLTGIKKYPVLFRHRVSVVGEKTPLAYLNASCALFYSQSCFLISGLAFFACSGIANTEQLLCVIMPMHLAEVWL